MTKEKIINGNMLVANFMGDYFDTGLEPAYYIRKNQEYDVRFAHYHDSWDWLIPVLAQIMRQEFTIPKFNLPMVNAKEKFHREIYSDLYWKNIEDIFKEVVIFVNIYNKNVK